MRSKDNPVKSTANVTTSKALSATMQKLQNVGKSIPRPDENEFSVEIHSDHLYSLRDKIQVTVSGKKITITVIELPGSGSDNENQGSNIKVIKNPPPPPPVVIYRGDFERNPLQVKLLPVSNAIT